MNKLADVKKIREANHLTQKQLAEMCGVTLRTVQNWEAGKTIPDNILRLLQSLTSTGEIVSPSSNNSSMDEVKLNLPVEQHVKGTNNHFSGTGDVSEGVPASLLQQALDEVTAQRVMTEKALAQVERLVTVIERLSNKHYE